MVRIYVGNLSYTTSDRALRLLFESYGSVESVQLPTDAQTERTRGFAIVGMDDPAAAGKAIAALNGHQLDGRKIIVNEARPYSPSGPVAGQPRPPEWRQSA